MSDDPSPCIIGTIEVLIAYKRGHIDLKTASERFFALTGIDHDIAEKHIKAMTRDSVLSLQKKQVRGVSEARC